jgi:hypothetical protein
MSMLRRVIFYIYPLYYRLIGVPTVYCGWETPDGKRGLWPLRRRPVNGRYVKTFYYKFEAGPSQLKTDYNNWLNRIDC